jgi:palmitoyltransferase
MEFLAAFGIVLLFLGSLLYLLVCIDPNRPGFLGKIHRFVFNDFPEIMRKILGDRVINFFGGIIHYVFYTNHPLV